MASPINTYGAIGNQTAGWYVRRLLKYAMPVLILERYGNTQETPTNETKIVEFRRPKPFNPATTPLDEGVPPSGSPFGYESVSTQYQQFGDWTGITDHVADTSKDKVLRDASKQQGHQIGLTREKLTWDVIRAGTAVTRGNNVTARTAIDSGSVLSPFELRRVVAQLDEQKGMHYTEVLAGSEDYDTFAVEATFICVMHTDMKPTVRDLKGSASNNNFTPTSKYGASFGVTHPRELGHFEECRFVASPELDPWRGAGATNDQSGDNALFKATTVSGTSKYDVYPVLMLAKDAWGCVALRGKKAAMPKVVNVETPSKSDPLGQSGSIGWKMWFACLILNNAWMRRLEVACKV